MYAFANKNNQRDIRNLVLLLQYYSLKNYLAATIDFV